MPKLFAGFIAAISDIGQPSILVIGVIHYRVQMAEHNMARRRPRAAISIRHVMCRLV